MAELKINADNLGVLVLAIKNSTKGINTSTKSINDPSNCKGIMITAYVDRIRKIGKLLESYKQLLEKDAVDVVASKNKIIEMDQNIKTLYRNNNSNNE